MVSASHAPARQVFLALDLQNVYLHAPHIIVTALATLSLHADHAKHAEQDCAPTPTQTYVSTLACGWPWH